jgi:hypothetical protein
MAIKRILRYLRGTSNLKLKLFPQGNNLVAFADSDWAGDILTRKSTSGYLVFYADCLISWKSKRQHTVALSTLEGEFYALAGAIQEIIWEKNLLKELDAPIRSIILNEDNMGCISYIKNPIFHGRTKHIDIKLHFIRDYINRTGIKLEYCSTDENAADILTKPLARVKFEKFRSKMNLIPAFQGNVTGNSGNQGLI